MRRLELSPGQMVSSLHQRNYRLFFFGQLVSVAGTCMQSVAQSKTTLQLTAKPEMRGRVMALWALAWLGSTPIGGPIIGWAGQAIGARWALVIGGVATLACGILALPALTRIDRRAVADTPPAPAARALAK